MKISRGSCNRLRIVLYCCASLVCGTAHVSAAAPVVNYLYPAGAMRGTTAKVSIGGKLGDGPVLAWCSRTGLQVETSSEDDQLEIAAAPDAAGGLYWIRLYNVEGASALRPFVVGVHPDVLEAEPNNDLQNAHRIEPEAPVVNGALDSSKDVDTFAVDLRAGQTLVADVTANRVLGSPMDAVLQVVSPDGFVVAQNDDDQELDPRIVFTAPDDGVYFVRTFAFPAAPNQSIRFHNSSSHIYRLILTTGPFVDHAWPLAVAAGSRSHVQLRGWNLGDEFNTLGVDATGQPGVASLFDGRLTNSVDVQIVPHPVAVEVEADDPQLLEFPMSLCGRLDQPEEADEYRLTVSKGQQLVFQIESRELGFPMDPVLMLIGPDGRTLQEADDAGRGEEDVTLTYTVKADGEHRLRVLDRFGNGGFRYVYLLTAKLAQPDLALTVASDAFTLTADKPLEIPVSVNRTGGFAEEVEVTAVDLPPGVSVKPAVSGREGDSSKSVKLILERSDRVRRPGTFRIVGKTTGESARYFTATTTVSPFKAPFTEFWLNVPGAPSLRPPVKAVKPLEPENGEH